MIRLATLTAATLSLALLGTACNKDTAPTTNPGDAAAGAADDAAGAADDAAADDAATEEATEEDAGGGW